MGPDRTRTESAIEPLSFDRAFEILAAATVYAVALLGGLVGLLPILAGRSPRGADAMGVGAAVGAVAGVLLGGVYR